jgi:hypothetical protein
MSVNFNSSPMLTMKMHDLQSSRVGLTSLLSTVAKIPTKEVIGINSYVAPTLPLKFNKDRRFRMATTACIAD